MARSAKKKASEGDKSTPKKSTSSKSSSKRESVGGGADSSADSDWGRCRPSKEGEATVVMKNGATITGMVIREDDTIIALGMGIAEMEWQKRDLKEIIRFKRSSCRSGDVAEKPK